MATTCLATLDTTTRHVSAGLSVLVTLWFRSAIQAVITKAAVQSSHGGRILQTQHPRFQLARGMLLFACSILAFLSFKYMPMGEFTAISLLAPLVIILLEAWLLKEKIRPLRWLLLLGGINSGFQTLTSKMAKTKDAIVTHFYTGWIGTAMASLLLPFVWNMPADWTVWFQLLLMGVLASIGHFLLILAYDRTPDATLTPYLYTQIGFAVLGDGVVFNHLPDPWTLTGMGLAALCGALGAWLTVRKSRIAVQAAQT